MANYPASSPVPHFFTEAFLAENLTHLTWPKHPQLPGVSLMWCSLFLNPRMKSFSMMTGWDPDEDDITAINIFLELISFRAPHLKIFEFQYSQIVMWVMSYRNSLLA